MPTQNWLQKIWGFMLGKKTYVLGFCLTVTGIYTKNWQMVVGGLTLITGRSAVATEITNVVEAIDNQSKAVLTTSQAIAAAVAPETDTTGVASKSAQ